MSREDDNKQCKDYSHNAPVICNHAPSFVIVEFRHKKRTAAIENEDILSNFFDTVMRFVYVYQNLRKRNTNSNKN